MDWNFYPTSFVNQSYPSGVSSTLKIEKGSFTRSKTLWV